jgi:hypothetical protein
MRGHSIGRLAWIDITTSIVAIFVFGVGSSIVPGNVHSVSAAVIAPVGERTENGQDSESASPISPVSKNGPPTDVSAVEAIEGESVSGCNVIEVPGGLLEITCGTMSSAEDSKDNPGDEILPDPAAMEQADAELTTWLEANDQQAQEAIANEPVPTDSALPEAETAQPDLAQATPEALPDPAAMERADAELTIWLEANDRQVQQQIEREMQQLQRQQQPRAR